MVLLEEFQHFLIQVLLFPFQSFFQFLFYPCLFYWFCRPYFGDFWKAKRTIYRTDLFQDWNRVKREHTFFFTHIFRDTLLLFVDIKGTFLFENEVLGCVYYIFKYVELQQYIQILSFLDIMNIAVAIYIFLKSVARSLYFRCTYFFEEIFSQ